MEELGNLEETYGTLYCADHSLVGQLVAFDIAHNLRPPSVKFSRGRGTESLSISMRVTKEKKKRYA